MIKEELDKFAEWLWKEKALSVFEDVTEYIESITKPKKTFDELVRYLCVLNMANHSDAIRKHAKGPAGRVKGMIVHYVMHNNMHLLSLGWHLTSQNIYEKIFGYKVLHDTALYWKNDVDFLGEELRIYNKMVDYINTYDIQWYDRSEKT